MKGRLQSFSSVTALLVSAIFFLSFSVYCLRRGGFLFIFCPRTNLSTSLQSCDPSPSSQRQFTSLESPSSSSLSLGWSATGTCMKSDELVVLRISSLQTT